MKARLVLFIGIFVLWNNALFSQTNYLSIKLTYKASQKEVGKILNDIETYTSCKFTYNSALINSQEKVSIQVNQKPLEDVLKILFLNKFEYKQIGNQILISPSKTYVPTKAPPTITKPDKPTRIKQVFDTVRIYDTIRTYISDTITTYDTITIIDSTDIKEKSSLVIRKESTNITLAYYTGNSISYPLFYGSNEVYNNSLNNAEKIAISSSKTLMTSYQKKNFNYGIGVQLQNIQQKTDFTTSYFIDDPSETYSDTLWYWNYKLLFTYYKYNPGSDSILIPVYDSTYTFKIEENQKKIEKRNEYKTTNSYKYVGIPLQFGYRYFINYKFELQTNIVISPIFLVKSQGYLPNNLNNNGISLEDIGLKKITYSTALQWNFIYHINKYYSVHLKPLCYSLPNIMKSSKTDFKKSHLLFGIEWGFSYSIPYEIF